VGGTPSIRCPASRRHGRARRAGRAQLADRERLALRRHPGGWQCNGRPFTAQVERQGLWTVVEHNGRRIEAMVMSARAAELLRVMPFKAPAT
jgi:hypothetical protein